MSFSSDVKEEIVRSKVGSRHCRIAEMAAFIHFGGYDIKAEEGEYHLEVHTENAAVAKRFFSLLKDTFGVHGTLEVKKKEYLKKSRNYSVSVDNREDCVLILKAIKYFDPEKLDLVLQNSCCKRAYIRGAFLAAGSVSDPEKNYHFEIVSSDDVRAHKLMQVMNFFELDAKCVERKKYFVVYMKEGTRIVDVLNIMEAHIALMNFENIRIVKDMRNAVNRRVNCETANINKTVSAAVRQREDIELIQTVKGMNFLSDGLREVAYLRLEYPEASLKELGELLQPPVGKSGVNHRLKKLGRIADDIRTRGGVKHHDFKEYEG